MPQDPVADYLRSLNMSDRARAAAWDAAYAQTDDEAQRRLQALPFVSDEVRANLWDLRHGGTLQGPVQDFRPARAEDFIPQEQQPEGSAIGRFVSNAAEMLNPIAAAQGIYQAVTSPLETAQNIMAAQGEQFGQAREAFKEGRYSEAVGHGAAGLIPLVGPAAASAGEQIASGDVAGGLGAGVGLLVPAGAPAAARGAVRAAKTATSPRIREAVASSLERGAAGRVADVMAPKVGPNKTRFGNRAEDVAPALAQDLARGRAPLSREGFHAQVGERLAQAEQALDAAADARLAARTFETKPLVDALLEKRRQLTAEAVEGSRRIPSYVGPRGGRVPSIRGRGPGGRFQRQPATSAPTVRDPQTGQMRRMPGREGRPIGEDVVPGPNEARVAVIDQAIEELRQLGPVTRYEPIRRIRQAYDAPARAVYNPSMTADFLKAQGGKLGAADVTGVLREALAQWDPQTAAANADYALYRTADDVLEATREVERTRPRVGRLIAAQVIGGTVGAQAAGAAGAITGAIVAPAINAGLAMGLTTKLWIAALQQRLANAIRQGNVQQVASLSSELRRLVPQAGVLTERTGEAVRVPTGAETPGAPAPATARQR